jgi:hypothetical protein
MCGRPGDHPTEPTLLNSRPTRARGATFSGSTVFFAGATFSDGMVFFAGATFSDGMVFFAGATFSDGTVIFNELVRDSGWGIVLGWWHDPGVAIMVNRECWLISCSRGSRGVISLV